MSKIFLFFLAIISPTAHALEVVNCVAQEYKRPDDLNYRYFHVTAKLRNEGSAKFIAKKESATQPPQVLAGFFHHGDCKGAGGSEGGMEISGAIKPKGTGTAKAGLGFNLMERGKNKLVFYVNTNPESEKEAAGIMGPNCSFEPQLIQNPKHFKTCKVKMLKK